jgi:hypothetical protein
MIWFFEREEARLSYEIRTATEGTEYELVITHPDGSQQVEAFSDTSVLMERSVNLRDNLHAQGWQPPGRRPRRQGRASSQPQRSDRERVSYPPLRRIS